MNKAETEEKIKTCPECGKNWFRRCDCYFNDRSCTNGHTWYVNKEGKVIVGKVKHVFPYTTTVKH